MPEINCIKIRDYKNFKYFGYSVSNIWKGYDDEDHDEIFIFFDIKGNGFDRNQTFTRETTLQGLKNFVKEFDQYFWREEGERE